LKRLTDIWCALKIKTMKKNEGYKIRSHMFKGSNEFGYTYEITFNKSLEHTGRMQGIERGLDAYVKQELKEELTNTPARTWRLLLQWLKSK
jgi:hypothetical protein